MISEAMIVSKTTVDRALQQQLEKVWKTLQDTRSNLFVCDTLVRHIVKPAPAVSTTVSRRTDETWMQTDDWPVASVGTQCARNNVESESCQTVPELCTQGVQTEDCVAAVKNESCQAVADLATSVVQTSEAGVPQDVRAVTGDLAGVSHREYQRLKRKTEVLKRRLRAERSRNVRALSGDTAYRLSALRLATLALSIQETYQEMVLDLGSLLQQLAALVYDAAVPITLPPVDGVGGWYRQVRELAAAALRSLIEKRAGIVQTRSEVSEARSRESLPVENIQREGDLMTVVNLEGHLIQTQITNCAHSLSLPNPGREELDRVRRERQRSSPSAENGDDRSAGVCGRISSRASIWPQTVICLSQKSTPRENLTDSERSFPFGPQPTHVEMGRHAGQTRKCSQSHQMCDSDLGPCLESKIHGNGSRHRSSGDSTSEGEDAVDIACCSHTCHHNTYLKTFVESQKNSQVEKEMEGSVRAKNIILNNSGVLENVTNVIDVGATSPDTMEATRQSCAHSSLPAHEYDRCSKIRKDRSYNSVPVGAESEQKPTDHCKQYDNVNKRIISERPRSSTSSEPPSHFQREHTAQQSGRRHPTRYLTGVEGQAVAKGPAKSFCSAPSLGAKELPEQLRDQVELLEKGPTSSDYTETISSSITVSRTSYNSASSSSVPKTKLRTRRAVRPVTSSGTESRSPKIEEISLERSGEKSESACDESATLTPKSGSLSAQQSLHLRFVEILDELKEKLLQCNE